MTINEIKNTLFEKLNSENCCFKKSDIKVERTEKGYDIIIKDYEHITYHLELEKDEYLDYCVWIYENWCYERNCLTLLDSKNDYRLHDALLILGYHIANTF